MPIITPKVKDEFTAKKIKLHKEVFFEIERYCEWAKIEELDYFFSEAAKQIFSKDKEWRALQADG